MMSNSTTMMVLKWARDSFERRCDDDEDDDDDDDDETRRDETNA